MKKGSGWLILFLFSALTVAYGHSGGTDSRGGHHDRRNGGYHFHHGMGPHQHPGGVCEYASVARSDRNRSSVSKEKSYTVWYLGGVALVGYWIYSGSKSKSLGK